MRGWVDDRTRSKAKFFGPPSEYKPYLFETIGQDQLPEDLGGTHSEWPVCDLQTS